MSEPILPPVPAQAPRINSRFWPWLMRTLLRFSGWRLQGQLPNLPKVIIIGAPHSSYWDGVWGLMMKIGLRHQHQHHDQTRSVGWPAWHHPAPDRMIPINRSAALNVVDQMVQRFGEYEEMWLGITPEGTRKRVTQWKSGFLRIARDAKVPIQTLFIDYPTKTFTLGPLVHASDDPDADMSAIRALFRPYRGKHRNTE